MLETKNLEEIIQALIFYNQKLRASLVKANKYAQEIFINMNDFWDDEKEDYVINCDREAFSKRMDLIYASYAQLNIAVDKDNLEDV